MWNISSSEKKCCKKQNSPEKVATIYGSFFAEKNSNAEHCFSEKSCTFSDKVVTVQKYLLRKGSSSVDIFILNNSSAKKVGVLKSTALRNFLFSKSGYL